MSTTPPERKGGGNSEDNVTVYETDPDTGEPTKFIDLNGEAKLIYTVVSDMGTQKCVKITDMERDPRSSSYAVFPGSITYNGNEYIVIGNKVEAKNSGYIDTEGDFKLTYSISSAGAAIDGYEYSGDSAVSVVFPSKITVDENTEYRVIGINLESNFKDALIRDLTIIVERTSSGEDYSYTIYHDFMRNNQNLESLKFVVDNDSTDYSQNHQLVQLYAYEVGSIANVPFSDCTNLKYLSLPNAISTDYMIGLFPKNFLPVFSGCTSLGSGATSDNPFVLNTKFYSTAAHCQLVPFFNGCSGLRYVELGKNVDQGALHNVIGNNDLYAFTGCPNLEIIYNSSPNVTEDILAKCIVNSGSYNVLLFMLGGGELTRGASIVETSSGDSSVDAGRSWNITMPEATFGGVEIPSWTHKDNTARFDSGIGYDSFSPWKSSDTVFGYYYYPLYGTCTVTYNIINGGKTVETVKQDVVCMYNTQLYDENEFSDDYREAIKNNGTWILTDSTDSDATYKLGQSVTLSTNLLLCMILDDNYNTDVTVTINLKYISNSEVKTYTYQKTYSGSERSDGKITLPDLSEFRNNAKDSSGDYIPSTIKYIVRSDGVVSNGEIIALGTTITAFCDFTITLYLMMSIDPYYCMELSSNDGNNVKRDFAYYDTGPLVVPLNTFEYKEDGSVTKHFLYWSNTADGSGGHKYYPGDRIDLWYAIYLYAIWGPISETELVSVEYNLYEEGSGTYKSDTKTYTYGSIEDLPTYTRDRYVLIGWSYTPIQNVNFSLDVPVTMRDNLRLYAVWAEVPTVIVDNLVYSVDEVPSGDYNPGFLFIGEFTAEDKVRLTITFMKGESKIDKPTETGIYIMKIGYQVYRNGTDVTKEYYSDYDGSTPVTKNCYDGFLTIYNGNSSSVIV